MVGLLTALPETRLYHRLMQEGRLEREGTGNNTPAALNFRPTLSREFLISGYRQLMRKLYEPRHYYQRIRRFLEHTRHRFQRLSLTLTKLTSGLEGLIRNNRMTLTTPRRWANGCHCPLSIPGCARR
jgi:hypothetical protein